MKILVYHHIDADGFMSALIVRYALLSQKNLSAPEMEFVPFNYGQVDITKVTKKNYDKVFVVDAFLGVEPTKLLRDEFQGNFIWIDHRATSLEDEGLS